MPLTATEKISRLEAQVAELRGELKELKTKLPPPPPIAAPPKRIPGAAPQGDYGMNFPGPPSEIYGNATGTVGVTVDAKTGYRKFPDGLVRDELGQVVPHPIAHSAAARPVLQERDWQHEQAVRILDRIIETTASPYNKEDR
jgi:hypothetical protein